MSIQETIGYNKNHDSRADNDFYATPPKEVMNILSKEKLYGSILYNCCGEGHITKEVKTKYPNNYIIATDLIDYGYGEGELDFLSDSYPYTAGISTIIMNPPFSKITEFTTKSISIANKKVVLFARLQFLESIDRYEKIFKDHKPTRFYIYVDRIGCGKNGSFDNTANSMCFGWFIWDKVDTHNGFFWIRKA